MGSDAREPAFCACGAFAATRWSQDLGAFDVPLEQVFQYSEE